MHLPFKRKPKPYEAERTRLLKAMETLDPYDPDYKEVMTRLDQLDRILNRSSEKFKTVVPALGTVVAIGGIYGLQQFAGVIVPKALETLAARQEQKKIQNEND